jgi:hypothetical protein
MQAGWRLCPWAQMQVLSNLLNAPTRVHRSRQNSRNCPPTRRQIDAIWAACGIGIWFDLFWSCFHLVWYCEKWIEMAGRARWQTIWMMTLHYGSVSLAAMLLMFADLMDLNGHILRLVDVLDIQTSSISSWFVFLRPLRTSTLRSLVTWLQKDRRQVEGHFDIKTKHLQHFAIILPFCSCIMVSRTPNRAVLICSDLKNRFSLSLRWWDGYIRVY